MDDNVLKVEDIKASAESKACPVQKALYYVEEFIRGPMCGRCLPCALGIYEAKMILADISEGKAAAGHLSNLRVIASNILEGSLCKKGKDSAKYLLEWIDAVGFEGHVKGICRDFECKALVRYEIIPEDCTSCGLCKDACSYRAILGEKMKPYLSGYKPFEIRQKRCVKCGECIKVCPSAAITLSSSGCATGLEDVSSGVKRLAERRS